MTANDIVITNHCQARFCQRCFKTKDRNLIKAIILDSKEIDLPLDEAIYKLQTYKENEKDRYFYNQEYRILFTLSYNQKQDKWIAVTTTKKDKKYKEYNQN